MALRKVGPVRLNSIYEAEVEKVGDGEELEVEPRRLENPESLFDDDAPVVSVPSVPIRPDDGIPALDSDLTPDEKAEFVKLLDKYMPLDQRAKQLVHLASLKGQKTAAVGLRAIQEILALTGIRGDRPTEAPAMFQLPEGTSVSVKVTQVKK